MKRNIIILTISYFILFSQILSQTNLMSFNSTQSDQNVKKTSVFLSDSNITEISSYKSDYNGGIIVKDHIAYFCNSTFLEITNFTNIYEPSKLSQLQLNESFYEQELVDNKAYIVAGGRGLNIVDIQDPSNPILLGNLEKNNKLAEGISIQGKYAFVAWGDDGLRIIDITDPSNLSEVGHFNINNGIVNDVIVKGNYAYVAFSNYGLKILDISDESNPNEIGSYDTDSTDAVNLVIYNNYLFITDYQYLTIYDISEPNNPSVISTTKLNSPAKLFISSNFAYIAQLNNGLLLLDISDLSKPKIAGYWANGGWITDIYVYENLIYAAGNDSLYLLKNNLITGINNLNKKIPTNYSLSQNYPNPFNPTTNIQFSIPEANYVSLKIYDLLGKEIAVLVDKTKSAGSYTYTFDASKLTSGVYVYRLQAGKFVSTKKLVLIK